MLTITIITVKGSGCNYIIENPYQQDSHQQKNRGQIRNIITIYSYVGVVNFPHNLVCWHSQMLPKRPRILKKGHQTLSFGDSSLLSSSFAQ